MWLVHAVEALLGTLTGMGHAGEVSESNRERLVQLAERVENLDRVVRAMEDSSSPGVATPAPMPSLVMLRQRLDTAKKSIEDYISRNPVAELFSAKTASATLTAANSQLADAVADLLLDIKLDQLSKNVTQAIGSAPSVPEGPEEDPRVVRTSQSGSLDGAHSRRGSLGKAAGGQEGVAAWEAAETNVGAPPSGDMVSDNWAEGMDGVSPAVTMAAPLSPQAQADEIHEYLKDLMVFCGVVRDGLDDVVQEEGVLLRPLSAKALPSRGSGQRERLLSAESAASNDSGEVEQRGDTSTQYEDWSRKLVSAPHHVFRKSISQSSSRIHSTPNSGATVVSDVVRHLTESREAAMEGVVLLGDDGAGKSCVLSALARRLAQEALDMPDRPIPILVSLADYTPRGGVRNSDMLAVLADMFVENSVRTRTMIELWQEGRLAILLDDVDLLEESSGAPGGGASVHPAVANAVASGMLWKQSMVIMTCRTSSHSVATVLASWGTAAMELGGLDESSLRKLAFTCLSEEECQVLEDWIRHQPALVPAVPALISMLFYYIRHSSTAIQGREAESERESTTRITTSTSPEVATRPGSAPEHGGIGGGRSSLSPPALGTSLPEEMEYSNPQPPQYTPTGAIHPCHIYAQVTEHILSSFSSRHFRRMNIAPGDSKIESGRMYRWTVKLAHHLHCRRAKVISRGFVDEVFGEDKAAAGMLWSVITAGCMLFKRASHNTFLFFHPSLQAQLAAFHLANSINNTVKGMSDRMCQAIPVRLAIAHRTVFGLPVAESLHDPWLTDTFVHLSLVLDPKAFLRFGELLVDLDDNSMGLTLLAFGLWRQRNRQLGVAEAPHKKMVQAASKYDALRGLLHPDQSMRELAIYELGSFERLQDKAVVDGILKVLGKKDVAIPTRIAAAHSLGMLGSVSKCDDDSSRRIVITLIGMLRDGNVLVMREAARGLAVLFEGVAWLAPCWSFSLSDGEFRTFMTYYRADDKKLRHYIGKILRSRVVLEFLLVLLNSPEPRMVMSTMDALVALGGLHDRVVSQLLRKFEDFGTSKEVRVLCARHLCAYIRDPKDETTQKMLRHLDAAHESDASVRGQILTYLVAIRNTGVRRATVATLGRLLLVSEDISLLEGIVQVLLSSDAVEVMLVTVALAIRMAKGRSASTRDRASSVTGNSTPGRLMTLSAEEVENALLRRLMTLADPIRISRGVRVLNSLRARSEAVASALLGVIERPGSKVHSLSGAMAWEAMAKQAIVREGKIYNGALPMTVWASALKKLSGLITGDGPTCEVLIEVCRAIRAISRVHDKGDTSASGIITAAVRRRLSHEDKHQAAPNSGGGTSRGDALDAAVLCGLEASRQLDVRDDETVNTILRWISVGSETVMRAAAANLIAFNKTDELVEALLLRLSKCDQGHDASRKSLRLAIVQTLAMPELHYVKGSVEALLGRMVDCDPEVRMDAMVAVASHSYAPARIIATEALAGSDQKNTRIMRTLAQLLQDPEPQVQAHARQAYNEQAFLNTLAQLLQSANWEERLRATQLVRDLAGGEVVGVKLKDIYETLVSMLEGGEGTKNTRVLRGVVTALISIGAKSTYILGELASRLDAKDSSAADRLTAAELLCRVISSDAPATSSSLLDVVPKMARRIQSPGEDWRVRDRLMQAFGSIHLNNDKTVSEWLQRMQSWDDCAPFMYGPIHRYLLDNAGRHFSANLIYARHGDPQRAAVSELLQRGASKRGAPIEIVALYRAHRILERAVSSEAMTEPVTRGCV